MNVAIDDPQLADKVSRLAHTLGKTIEETVQIAIDEKVARDLPKVAGPIDWAEVNRILAEVDKLPRLDQRSADEIIGYNEHGHFD